MDHIFVYRIEPEYLKSNRELSGITDGKLLQGSHRLPSYWEECIPDESDPLDGPSYYGFSGDESIEGFLYDLCNLTENDLKELDNNSNIKLYKLEVECIVKGLSKTRGTFFKSEIISNKQIRFSDIKNTGEEFSIVHPGKKLIKECYQKYYKH